MEVETLDLLEFKGFNEEFQVNEDYELNIRLRKNGRKVILITNLIVDYFVRSSLLGLIKQFLNMVMENKNSFCSS